MAGPADIERRLDYLRDSYGEFPVESGTYTHDSGAFERIQTNHERGVPGATRVWVERGDETLLVRTHYRPDAWGVAGGLIEPDERSDEAGTREIREETSIECEILDVAYAHIAENRIEDGGQEPIEELAVAFVAQYTGGELDIQSAEIHEAKWWREIPANAYPPASRIGPERL